MLEKEKEGEMDNIKNLHVVLPENEMGFAAASYREKLVVSSDFQYFYLQQMMMTNSHRQCHISHLTISQDHSATLMMYYRIVLQH